MLLMVLHFFLLIYLVFEPREACDISSFYVCLFFSSLVLSSYIFFRLFFSIFSSLYFCFVESLDKISVKAIIILPVCHVMYSNFDGAINKSTSMHRKEAKRRNKGRRKEVVISHSNTGLKIIAVSFLACSLLLPQTTISLFSSFIGFLEIKMP